MADRLSIADYCGMDYNTSSNKIVHQVSVAIASLNREYIKFPETTMEIRYQQAQFYRIARFPRAVGATDCVHVRIMSPGGDNAELYSNRKGYFSINVQTIGNANLEIQDNVGRWPGSSHNSHIFNNCIRKARFEAGNYDNALLLVDGGYTLTSYMLPPLKNPSTPAEQLYNESQIRSKNPVKQLYGVWKRRFPVLALGRACKTRQGIGHNSGYCSTL